MSSSNLPISTEPLRWIVKSIFRAWWIVEGAVLLDVRWVPDHLNSSRTASSGLIPN